jgi:hypothetical protein
MTNEEHRRNRISLLSTTTKYCRGIIHKSTDTEFNSDSESAQSIPRQYLEREKIPKKTSKN